MKKQVLWLKMDLWSVRLGNPKILFDDVYIQRIAKELMSACGDNSKYITIRYELNSVRDGEFCYIRCEADLDVYDPRQDENWAFERRNPLGLTEYTAYRGFITDEEFNE